MIVYLDTSALVKIVRPEPGSADLRVWLESREEQLLATSALAEVELSRTLRRIGAKGSMSRAVELLEELLLIEIDPEVRRAAADLPEPLLRSLDAIHLASAYQLRPDLTAIVTYDVRIARAVDSGIEVASPGAVLPAGL